VKVVKVGKVVKVVKVGKVVRLWDCKTLGTLELWNPGTLEPWNPGILELPVRATFRSAGRRHLI
jgi:hypothetical protein